jgi:hypothetical protein
MIAADGILPAVRHQTRTLIIAALGGALEFYDFIIFVFFANAIGQLFFPPDTADWLRQLQTFGLFAAGYFARPLGALSLSASLFPSRPSTAWHIAAVSSSSVM